MPRGHRRQVEKKVFGVVSWIGTKPACTILIKDARRPSQMAPTPNTTGPEAGQSPWLGIVKFLLLAILIGLIFLLGEEMVRHRFFRGGWVDQHDVLKP